MSKDFQFVQKHLHVPSGQDGVLSVFGQDCVYMDKKGVAVKGDLSAVAILVKCGNNTIDLTNFANAAALPSGCWFTYSTTEAYCVIPFPVDVVTVVVDNADSDTDVSFYAGSA